MRRKMSFFTVVVVSVIGLALLPTLSRAAEDVKIGVILPLSGPLAKLGLTIKNAMELATGEINTEGGIKSLGGAKLQLIFGDSQGKPEVGQTTADQLIHKDNVAAIIGAYQSGVTLPATAVAERFKVPFLVQTSVNVDITNRGFKYTFRSKQTAVKDAGTQVDLIYGLGQRTGIKAKTVAIVNENSEWGQNNAQLLKQYLPGKGFDVAFQESYAATAADLTPLILKIKQAKPDVLMLTSWLADGILICKTIAKQEVDFMGVTNAGGGQNDPTYLPSLGRLADYEFAVTEFDIGLLKSKPWAKPINDAFKAKYGEDLSAASGEGYSNIWLIKDVLERAASTDREKIREAFARTNYTSGKALIMPYQKIVFDEKGQNPYADELMVQAYKGEYHIVYPFDLAEPGYKVVWPRPKWSER